MALCKHTCVIVTRTQPVILNLWITEEIISSNSALWWSPDSTKLLFGAFDDNDVGIYSFTKYGDKENQYDTIVSIPYPKVGV